MRDAGFRRLRVQLDDFISAHSNWRLMLIRGSENRAANALARKALVGGDGTSERAGTSLDSRTT